MHDGLVIVVNIISFSFILVYIYKINSLILNFVTNGKIPFHFIELKHMKSSYIGLYIYIYRITSEIYMKSNKK